MLNKWQRNKIYKAIAESNLDLAEFEFTVDEDETTITHTYSESTFKLTIGRRASDFGYEARAIVTDGTDHLYMSDLGIENMLTPIQNWANEIKRYIETPDYWTEMKRSRELVAAIQWADIGNAPFTNDERRQIRVELEAIKEHVKEQFDLTSEQIAHIDERLDEAAEAAERIGRKDWRLLLYGTILNLFVADALPPEVARHILAMFVHVVVVLFGGGPPQILA